VLLNSTTSCCARKFESKVEGALNDDVTLRSPSDGAAASTTTMKEIAPLASCRPTIEVWPWSTDDTAVARATPAPGSPAGTDAQVLATVDVVVA
jgi:hypothetical protein